MRANGTTTYDVEVVREPDVVRDNGDIAKLLHADDALVQDLTRIRLETNGALDLVKYRFGVAESGGIWL